MREMLRSTFLLALGAAGSVVLGLATAKLWAVLLGPVGVGDLGLAQGLVTLVIIVCDWGMSSALVRQGSALVQEGRAAELGAILRTARRLLLLVGAAGAAVALLAAEPIRAALLGPGAGPGAALLVVGAGLLAVHANLDVAVLSAHQRPGDLSRIGFLGQLAATAVLVGFVGSLRTAGIAPGLVASAGARWLVVRVLARRSLSEAGVRRPDEVAGDARGAPRRAALPQELLRVGVTAMLGALLASGVEAVLPALVLHRLSREDVGLYRAAAGFSATYVGFALTIASQSYLPRVSAAVREPAKLRALILDQHELTLTMALPALLGLHLAAPVLIRALYSSEFESAARLLEWQLIGDLLRISSWAFTFAVFARSPASYLGISFVTASALVGLTWLGLTYVGLNGAGMAAIVAFGVQWLLAGRAAARLGAGGPDGRTVVSIGGALAAMAVVHGASSAGSIALRLGVGGAVAGLALVHAFFRLRRMAARA